MIETYIGRRFTQKTTEYDKVKDRGKLMNIIWWRHRRRKPSFSTIMWS